MISEKEKIPLKVIRKKWSNEDTEKLVSLFNQDIGVKTIARSLGRSCTSIYGKLLHLRQTKDIFLKCRRKRWTEDDKQYIRHCLEVKKLVPKKIADIFGVSYQAVNFCIFKYNLKKDWKKTKILFAKK